MLILVTGGAGYIGSHTAVSLLENNYDVVVLDNLCNSSDESLKVVEELTGKKVIFYQGDIRDKKILSLIFENHSIDAVIHFAALKSVGESNSIPLTYYSNNITGTLVLLECMQEYSVNKFIFSSSATVYGSNSSQPSTEADEIGGATNPYGSSKVMMECILKDFSRSQSDISIISLRYFNPTGAHPTGMLGEDPNGIPSNLIPYVANVAQEKYPLLTIYGADYPTKDGTGVRDYIHVMDLAFGHVKALNYIFSNSVSYEVYNLGTGQGYSVMEVISMFKDITGKEIPYVIRDRRQGDVAESWASPDRAKEKLKWEATKGLREMLEDVWRWQTMNPTGYHRT